MSTTTSVSTRHAVLRQGPLLLIIAATCAVLYSACSDSPAGAPAAQHRSSEAALVSDMVVEASFDGGYSSYRATLPPATVTGTISQTLEATWDPAVHRTVDPVVPQGWTSSYYAGATLLPAAKTKVIQAAPMSPTIICLSKRRSSLLISCSRSIVFTNFELDNHFHLPMFYRNV